MNIGSLNHKLTIWHNVEFMNEMFENDSRPEIYKTIWSDVTPQTGSLGKRAGVESILTNVTHKIIVQYLSGKNITNEMWFMYREHRFDIKFILNPYFSNETLEIFCEEVIG